MPPETHTIDGNPLYNLLKRKLGQLAGARPDTLRIIFLADVGSTLLNRLGSGGEIDPTRRRVSGREIVSHFLSTHRDRIDAVTVFAPKRELTWVGRGDLLWAVSIFSKSPIAGLREGVSEIASVLPKPRFQGYQARSLFRQGLFSPRSRGWYKGLAIGGKMGKELRIEVSARALLDLLAGRITAEQFRYSTGQREGDMNIFQHFLDAGRTLAGVQVEPRNIDEDDDRIVLHFRDDPAARELRLKKAGDDDL